MRLRNNIFAEAFRWLKKNWDGIRYQKDLAARIGVSEDTITRIMRDQTEVTDDFLCKFNEAFDNVFNYQWLRGEDLEHMLSADLTKAQKEATVQTPIEPVAHVPDMSSVFNAALAAKDETISSLKRELRTKEQQLADKDRLIESKEETIAQLKARLISYRSIIDKHGVVDLSNYPFTIGASEQKGITK